MKLFSIKHIKECSGSIVVLILILGILGTFSIYREPFLSGGAFPEAITSAIMSPPFGQRPMKKAGKCAPGLSKNTYKTQWKLYPRTPISSYAQVTNNKQYWRKPCNGTSNPPTMCGGLYDNIEIKKHHDAPMPPLSPQNSVRVNYYVSDAGRPPEL